MENVTNWGPRALAKFEGVARNERGGAYGERAALVHARKNNNSNEIRGIFNKANGHINSNELYNDVSELSPAARELLKECTANQADSR